MRIFDRLNVPQFSAGEYLRVPKKATNVERSEYSQYVIDLSFKHFTIIANQGDAVVSV
jgi:hypothetical protein